MMFARLHPLYAACPASGVSAGPTRLHHVQSGTCQSGLAIARITPGKPPPEPTSSMLHKNVASSCFDEFCCFVIASKTGRRAKESSICIWKASSSLVAPTFSLRTPRCCFPCTSRLCNSWYTCQVHRGVLLKHKPDILSCL